MQEAAYAQLTPVHAQAHHASYARWLINDITDPSRDPRLFAALDHCSKASDFVVDAAIGHRLTALALAGGTKAKTGAAYDLAVTYLSMVAALPASLSGLDWATTPTRPASSTWS